MSSPSTKDCVPRLMRLIPAATHCAAFSASMVSGSASSVTSSHTQANVSRNARSMSARSTGSRRLGVPPPIYTVSTTQRLSRPFVLALLSTPRPRRATTPHVRESPGTPPPHTAQTAPPTPRPCGSCSTCTSSGKTAPECKRRVSPSPQTLAHHYADISSCWAQCPETRSTRDPAAPSGTHGVRAVRQTPQRKFPASVPAPASLPARKRTGSPRRTCSSCANRNCLRCGDTARP